MEDKISLEHFVELLNKINESNINSLLSEKDIFRLQVLLLHLYTDYLMINIIKEDLPLHKDLLKRLEGFSTRLHIINAKGILDDNGFKAIKKLNSIRNDLQHKYEFNLDSMKDKIENLEELSHIKSPDFDKFTIIGKLQLICVHYINSLRGYLGRVMGEPTAELIIYRINTTTEKWTLSFQAGGEFKLMQK